jgi:WD40 repeat protein
MMMRKPREYSDSESGSGVAHKKVSVDLGHPCSALCLNRDSSLLAVVGRKVFKILRLGLDQIEAQNDLRDLPHKALNLNYSSNDVQWNPKDDAQLASAPTNGSVVLWDINMKTKNKLCHLFENEHSRAVNKLSFHPREPNVLLSGSQDSTMKIFDTRAKKSVQTYRAADCVRDVEFAPQFHENYFAACFDSGSLQIWDRRFPDSSIRAQSCHSGPAYCCSWHPDHEQWIMSAGRDKMIKVHDIQLGKLREVYTVPALFSVVRAKWRLGHKYHVTSCSLFLDNVVAVWDVRRPYIPFASFTEHSDDVTDFLWLNENVLISCSKDGKLVQQLMTKAQRPSEKATPVGLSFCPDGGVALACSDSIGYRNKATQSSMQYGTSRNPMMFRRPEVDPYQQAFLQHTSSLKEHKDTKNNPELRAFIQCATDYLLSGRPLHELCDHNYKVASGQGRHDVAQSWLMLKLLYCGEDTECSRLGLIPTSLTSSRISTSSTPPCITVEEAGVRSPSEESGLFMQPLRDRTASFESGHEDNEDEGEDGNPAMSAVMDFFEDDPASDQGPPESIVIPPSSHTWETAQLPPEPFRLKHNIVMRPPSPEHDASSAISTAPQSVVESNSSFKQPLQDSRALRRKSSGVIAEATHWNYQEVMAKMLKYYADQGDVQMSVTVLLVLGDRASKLVDELSMEHWFSSYIDLLSRQRLWCVAAEIIRDCPLESIRKRSQESTMYYTTCGHCNKSMESGGWQCHRCDKLTSWCSVWYVRTHHYEFTPKKRKCAVL